MFGDGSCKVSSNGGEGVLCGVKLGHSSETCRGASSETFRRARRRRGCPRQRSTQPTVPFAPPSMMVLAGGQVVHMALSAEWWIGHNLSLTGSSTDTSWHVQLRAIGTVDDGEVGEGRRAAAARSRMHLDGMAGARSRTGGGGVLTGGGVASDAAAGRVLRGGGGHGAGSEVNFFFFFGSPSAWRLNVGLGPNRWRLMLGCTQAQNQLGLSNWAKPENLEDKTEHRRLLIGASLSRCPEWCTVSYVQNISWTPCCRRVQSSEGMICTLTYYSCCIDIVGLSLCVRQVFYIYYIISFLW